MSDAVTFDGTRDIAAVSAWIDDQLTARWESCWQENLPAITDLHERRGEPAYGLYNRAVFSPIQTGLGAAGILGRPALPGTLTHSEEQWGPEDHRERRMWTRLHDRGATPIGTVVTRFFHDHTRLRLPARPTVVGLTELDDDRIRAIVVDDPSTWPSCRPGPPADPDRTPR